MNTTASPTRRTQAVAAELDQARKSGPLQTIIIPPCPDLLARMRAALQEADPDLNVIAQIASSDVAMAASLLKAANSAAYSSGTPVQTVGQAMNRLGLEKTAMVMTSFLTQRAIRVNSPHLQRFWQRAGKRAVAMQFMASKLPGMSPDMAHTYGLFCHVGMPVMLQSVRGYSGTLMEAAARIDRPFITTENANHRTDHAVVGALVARLWKLAPEVMVAIRRHHDLDMIGHEDTEPDVHTLVAAGLVAEHLMRRHEALEADVDWLANKQRALDWLHINEDELEVWDEELRPLLDATL